MKPELDVGWQILMEREPVAQWLTKARGSLSPESADRGGFTLLHYATMADRSEAVAPLIEWGCDVSRPESRGLTPLHLATIHQKANMVRALLDAGANVDARDNWGNTPLGRAVMNCDGVDGSCIRLLLAAGADRNLANNHGVSPLSLAGTIANHDLVQFFK